MKREGRQHGMVRTYRILPPSLDPRPETRYVHKFDSPPSAGNFTKVPSKPTSHSKFTGKYSIPRHNGCHLLPACKAKAKTKGTQKLMSSDVVMNSQLLSWRVVDGQPGLSFSGYSATDLLDHLSSDYIHDDDVYDPNYENDWTVDYTSPYRDDNEIGVEIKEEEEDDDDENNNGDENRDDNMSFCEVGFVLDQVEEDEGWCLVEEM